jgi:hypothetical protein
MFGRLAKKASGNHFAIPANAEIQVFQKSLDPGSHRGDVRGGFFNSLPG